MHRGLAREARGGESSDLEGGGGEGKNPEGVFSAQARHPRSESHCSWPTQDLSILTDRLSKINESLARKVQARNEYDKTIQETEAAYMKVGASRCHRSCL